MTTHNQPATPDLVALAEALRTKYGFRRSYPLQNELGRAVRRLNRPDPRKELSRLRKGEFNPADIGSAGVVALALEGLAQPQGYWHRVARSPSFANRQQARIARAIANFRGNTEATLGRPGLQARARFFADLRGIFEAGTGKRPTLHYDPVTDEYGGTMLAFVQDVLTGIGARRMGRAALRKALQNAR